MSRVFNFSAGPAVLPLEVLQQAQQELVDYRGTGMSVMEMSHRSKEYEAIIGGAEQSLRKLMDIPASYKVLFLQGGASTQFAMVPMNLYRRSKSADYIITGAWAKKAASEAKKYGSVKAVASSEDRNFCYIPDLSNVAFSPAADYVHLTTNNTIYGTLFPSLPDTGDVPIV
ncbi:MAG: aminotransferase class V-fold PLP-dependent enzyme, partial [Bacteroidota bacterium]